LGSEQIKKMKKYLYLTSNRHVICVFAKQKPNQKNTPPSGTWVVNEFINGEWLMPCFPEIMWETLRKFIYIGEIK